jgi:hypothetical protein
VLVVNKYNKTLISVMHSVDVLSSSIAEWQLKSQPLGLAITTIEKVISSGSKLSSEIILGRLLNFCILNPKFYPKPIHSQCPKGGGRTESNMKVLE